MIQMNRLNEFKVPSRLHSSVCFDLICLEKESELIRNNFLRVSRKKSQAEFSSDYQIRATRFLSLAKGSMFLKRI